VASVPKSNRITYEEWLRMPEVSDAREEVVDGEIRIMPPAKLKHTKIVQNLYDLIRPQTRRADVFIPISSFGLVIRREPLTTREPDLAVFKTETMVERDGYVHSAPQLLVEVLSPGNTKRDTEEMANYSELRVPEYWVVSPEKRTIEVLYLDNGQLRQHAILSEGSLKPRHFPDVQINIQEIWPD
jgi:Uma2 family endonuclease